VTLATNMLASLRPVDPSWADELDQMLEGRRKAEIEAIYSVCGAAGFADMLADALTGGGLPGVACCKGLVAGQLVVHNRRTGKGCSTGLWTVLLLVVLLLLDRRRRGRGCADCENGTEVRFGVEQQMGSSLCRRNDRACLRAAAVAPKLPLLRPAGEETDCSQPSSGWPRVAGHTITGDLELIAQYAYQTDGALAILVVQDAVIFQASAGSQQGHAQRTLLLHTWQLQPRALMALPCSATCRMEHEANACGLVVPLPQPSR
jgi:hypothetical protein